MVDQLSPVQLSIMSNRLDSVCRDMTNTMLLTARSSVLGIARDFSVSFFEIFTLFCRIILPESNFEFTK